MSDQPYKSEVKLKIRIVDEDGGAGLSEPQSAAGEMNDGIVSSQPTPQDALSEPGAGDEDQLLEILTDPHAPERDWLAACSQLQKHRKSSPKTKPVGKRRMALALSTAITIMGMAAGAAALFHWGPFAVATAPQKEAASTREIDFHPYMLALQKEIKSHWHPPRSSTSNKIGMHFKILKNGEISDVGFDRMSRMPEVDAAALKAIVEAMPAVAPLPANAPDSVDVSFTFDYSVDNSRQKQGM